MWNDHHVYDNNKFGGTVWQNCHSTITNMEYVNFSYKTRDQWRLTNEMRTNNFYHNNNCINITGMVLLVLCQKTAKIIILKKVFTFYPFYGTNILPANNETLKT